MKYKTALLWLGLATVAGGVLFETSYDVQDLEERLAALNHKIVQEQEAIQVLKAEWSFLNDPARLETLARAHLNLGPSDARQFVAAVESLPFRSGPAAPDAVPYLPPMAGLTVMPANYVPPGYSPTVQGIAAPAPVQPAALTPVVASAAKAATAVAAAAAKPVATPVNKAAVVKATTQPAAPKSTDSIGVMIARLGGNQ